MDPEPHREPVHGHADIPGPVVLLHAEPHGFAIRNVCKAMLYT